MLVVRPDLSLDLAKQEVVEQVDLVGLLQHFRQVDLHLDLTVN